MINTMIFKRMFNNILAFQNNNEVSTCSTPTFTITGSSSCTLNQLSALDSKTKLLHTVQYQRCSCQIRNTFSCCKLHVHVCGKHTWPNPSHYPSLCSDRTPVERCPSSSSKSTGLSLIQTRQMPAKQLGRAVI